MCITNNVDVVISLNEPFCCICIVVVVWEYEESI